MSRSLTYRPFVLAVVASLALVSLSACSSSSASATCTTSSGDLSDAVTATGDFGEPVDSVDFPSPLVSDSTQVSVLEEGSGRVLSAEDGWTIAFTAYSGASSSQSVSLGFTDSDLSTTPLSLQPSEWSSKWPGLATALECGRVGDRLAIVMSPEDTADMASSFGFDTDDSVVVVADILDGFSPRATGSSHHVSSLFPQVVLATDGTPGISTPQGTPPSETTVGVLKEGDGDSVDDSSTVTVQYSGWLWSDGSQFGTSWATGSFIRVTSDTVIPGFWTAVNGQKVGSQVIVIVPPDDAYGSSGAGTIPGDSTVVFVIDILSVS